MAMYIFLARSLTLFSSKYSTTSVPPRGINIFRVLVRKRASRLDNSGFHFLLILLLPILLPVAVLPPFVSSSFFYYPMPKYYVMHSMDVTVIFLESVEETLMILGRWWCLVVSLLLSKSWLCMCFQWRTSRVWKRPCRQCGQDLP